VSNKAMILIQNFKKVPAFQAKIANGKAHLPFKHLSARKVSPELAFFYFKHFFERFGL
jgi:hypothetical protein